MAEVVTLRARIEGKVQRVWFRAWTVEEATKRGLNGWVQNLPDGAVEALFSGPKEQVEDMLAACHQGPSRARVDKVSAEPARAPDQPGFTQVGRD